MTDDIVSRLRNHVRGDFEKTSEFMLGLAASEIERLRASVINTSDNAFDEIERLRRELDNLKAENQRLSQIASY